MDWNRHLLGFGTDHLLELTHAERKRIHNLKYFTWIEQQGKEISELNAQWSDRDYWTSRMRMAGEYDKLIREFNGEVGANSI